jgi:hypothetical protein
MVGKNWCDGLEGLTRVQNLCENLPRVESRAGVNGGTWVGTCQPVRPQPRPCRAQRSRCRHTPSAPSTGRTSAHVCCTPSPQASHTAHTSPHVRYLRLTPSGGHAVWGSLRQTGGTSVPGKRACCWRPRVTVQAQTAPSVSELNGESLTRDGSTQPCLWQRAAPAQPLRWPLPLEFWCQRRRRTSETPLSPSPSESEGGAWPRCSASPAWPGHSC